jgi:hypothetical protein
MTDGGRFGERRAMSHNKRRIFIASTYEDLRGFRNAAVEVVLQSGCEPETVGTLEGLSDAEIARECMRRVGECDACLLIMASRVGWVPSLDGPGEKSITHLEVIAAREADIPIVVFAADDALAGSQAPLGGLQTPADRKGYLLHTFRLDDVSQFRAALGRTLREILDLQSTESQ